MELQVTIEPDAQTVIQPGEAIVFSPRENTVSHTPVAKFTPPADGQAWTGSTTRTSFDIKVHPGWRPGKGHLFSLDGRVHDASAYSAGNSFPRISFGLGGLGDDNLLWSASVDKGGIFSYCPDWAARQQPTHPSLTRHSPRIKTRMPAVVSPVFWSNTLYAWGTTT